MIRYLFFFIFILSFSLNSYSMGSEIHWSFEPTVIAYSRLCHDDLSLSGEENVHLSTMCKVVAKSNLCTEVEPEDLLRCDELTNESYLRLQDVFDGCLEGIKDALGNIYEFLEQGAEWVWSMLSTEDDRSEFADGVAEMGSSAGLYVKTEYAKAYAESVSIEPFRTIEAAARATGKLGSIIINSVMGIVKQEVGEFACYNNKAKSEALCEFVTSVVFPPAGFFAILKGGPKAVRGIAKGIKGIKNKKVRVNAQIKLEKVESETGNPMHISQFFLTPLQRLKGRKIDKKEDVLVNAKIKDQKIIEQGTTDTYKIKLDDGTTAVWKPFRDNPNSNYRSEVLAYELDRKLGFDLVPPTVERTINGERGSVQLFKNSRKNSDVLADGDQFKKQVFFDYLISNTDRAGNNLVSPRGNIVSIDHGVAFVGPSVRNSKKEFGVKEKFLKEYIKTPEGRQIMDNINKLDTNELNSVVTDYVGSEGAKQLLERIDLLKSID